jgi:Fe/S biogenesis protein NfuA
MITVTDAARNKLIEIMNAKGQHGSALRLRITGRGSDEFNYDLRFVEMETCADDDARIDLEGLTLLIDGETAQHLPGTVIDFGGLAAGGLKIDNPNPVWEDATAAAVAMVIAKQINPGIKAHGGTINLVDVKEDVAYITMNGGCQGCGMAAVTLKLGIDRMIREAVPSIREVVDTTEHTQGKNPFFAAMANGQSPLAG